MPRPRKPTHLHLVTGTARADRHDPRSEPKPPIGIPEPPPHLTDRGKDAWRYLARLIEPMGVLTLADAVALGRLCECYAEVAELTLRIQELGSRTYETRSVKDGHMIRAYPEVAMLADADRRLKGYLSEFGLTPAARTKVKVAGMTQQDDPLAQYLS